MAIITIPTSIGRLPPPRLSRSCACRPGSVWPDRRHPGRLVAAGSRGDGVAHVLASTAIRFDEVTLGYGRRPAVHHLDGEILDGQPDRRGRAQRGRQVDPAQGHRRHLAPLDGHIRLNGPASDIAYLPQAAEIDRSFPLSCLRSRRHGPVVPRAGLFGGIARKDRTRSRRRWPRSASSASSVARSRPCRAARCSARCSPACSAGRSRDPARRALPAIDAKTTADLLDLVRRWHDESRTVVAVLHDLDMVSASSRRPC